MDNSLSTTTEFRLPQQKRKRSSDRTHGVECALNSQGSSTQKTTAPLAQHCPVVHLPDWVTTTRTKTEEADILQWTPLLLTPQESGCCSPSTVFDVGFILAPTSVRATATLRPSKNVKRLSIAVSYQGKSITSLGTVVGEMATAWRNMFNCSEEDLAIPRERMMRNPLQHLLVAVHAEDQAKRAATGSALAVRWISLHQARTKGYTTTVGGRRSAPLIHNNLRLPFPVWLRHSSTATRSSFSAHVTEIQRSNSDKLRVRITIDGQTVSSAKAVAILQDALAQQLPPQLAQAAACMKESHQASLSQLVTSVDGLDFTLMELQESGALDGMVRLQRLRGDVSSDCGDGEHLTISEMLKL